VGGIPISTTKQKLTSYFADYGHITDCIIMVDRDHSKFFLGNLTTFFFYKSLEASASSPSRT